MWALKKSVAIAALLHADEFSTSHYVPPHDSAKPLLFRDLLIGMQMQPLATEREAAQNA